MKKKQNGKWLKICPELPPTYVVREFVENFAFDLPPADDREAGDPNWCVLALEKDRFITDLSTYTLLFSLTHRSAIGPTSLPIPPHPSIHPHEERADWLGKEKKKKARGRRLGIPQNSPSSFPPSPCWPPFSNFRCCEVNVAGHTL